MLKFCLPDQVEQQIERAFERLEKDLERIGRDVEVGRQREQRLAVEPGDGDAVDGIGRVAAEGCRLGLDGRESAHSADSQRCRVW